MQYHASLITADGAYHCPVGSSMAIFLLEVPNTNQPLDIVPGRLLDVYMVKILMRRLQYWLPPDEKVMYIQGGFFTDPALKMTKQDQNGLDRSASWPLDQGSKVWSGLVSRSQGLKVLRSQGLKVSRSQGLMVSRSQGLKVSRSQDPKVPRSQGIKVSRS